MFCIYRLCISVVTAVNGPCIRPYVRNTIMNLCNIG